MRLRDSFPIDSVSESRLIGTVMLRPALAFVAMLFLAAPADALVGGATVARGSGAGRHLVMIIGTRGNVCTGTALGRDLVLTAGHCVAPPADYRVLIDAPPGLAISSIAVHPRYDPHDYASGRVTADVALIKLAAPLPEVVAPAVLAAGRKVSPNDRLVIAGFGVTVAHGDAGLGVPRTAALIVTGRPGNLQIRLVDPVTRGERPGLGACTGDSGGPAFVDNGGSYAIIGVVSWSTGPNGSEGCGGLTGVTPLSLYRRWIVDTARKMGTRLH